MGLSVLISAWLVGALGGLHCLTMCGGFLAAVATRDGGPQPLLPARSVAARQLTYHAGRIATYSLLGAAFGAAGAAIVDAADFVPLQRALYLAANSSCCSWARASRSAPPGSPGCSGAVRPRSARCCPSCGRCCSARVPRGGSRWGLIWGLVPCALVYSVLPLALFSGGAWQGGAVMLAFGLGTLPNLLAAGVLLARARRALEGRAVRYGAAAVLIAFALVGIWRVLYAPGALAQGPFCLVP